MLIGSDSPFRRLPATIPPRHVLFFDGVRYAAEMMHLAFGRLCVTLDSLPALAIGSNDGVDAGISAMTDAWTIADSTFRLRRLIEAFPGIPKKHTSPPIQVFL